MSNYKLNNIQYKGNHFYDFNINNSTLNIDKLYYLKKLFFWKFKKHLKDQLILKNKEFKQILNDLQFNLKGWQNRKTLLLISYNNKYYRKYKQNFIFFYRQKIIFKQKYKKYRVSYNKELTEFFLQLF